MITATHDLSIVEMIADRACVFNEAHQLVAVGAPGDILKDEALLEACNLIHEHHHWHPETDESHRHPHLHLPMHAHEHAEACR